MISAYQPRNMPADQWRPVEEFVKSQASDYFSRAARANARAYLSSLAQYAAWAFGTAGCALTRADIFDHERIAFYTAHVMARNSYSSRIAHRACLLAMADVLVPEHRRGIRMPPNANPDASAPYREDQIRMIRAWPQEQSTPYRRRAASCIVAFGLGAGLRTGELGELQPEDVTRDNEGVLVAVRGAHARLVPVLAEYEELCVNLASTTQPGSKVLRAYRAPDNPVYRPGWNVRLDTDTGFPITGRRLRATWIVGHLSRGVAADALRIAAGFDTFTAIDRYLPWVETAPLNDYRTAFRNLHRAPDSTVCTTLDSPPRPSEQPPESDQDVNEGQTR
ncbi:MAG: hypothetical protein QM779_13910 [Propionicimonas sp.]|uniref:hypothetical protein n=1 Tax=Propionicimonas sp. TaxID=1955623 RepID=UPI003D12933F